MKFFISRSSSHYDDFGQPIKPHDRAELVSVEYWDMRTFQTPEEHDAKFPTRPWYKSGRNHDRWAGGIKRQTGNVEKWVINLDDVIAFVKEVGQIVLSPPHEQNGADALYEIEIYDGYRE